MFKSNSRFSVLFEDNEKPDNNNKIKRDEKPIFYEEKKNYFKNENKYNRQQNDYEIRSYKEKKEIEEKKIAENININNFPELILINNKKTLSNEMNFLRVIKKVEPKCNKEKIIKQTPLYRAEEENVKKLNNEIAHNVLKRLAELYETRTHEYIESFGYDEWERIFRFPNYDYEYFDKLDEKYIHEIEEFDLEVINSDEESN